MDFNAIPENCADVNGFLEAGLDMTFVRFKPDAVIDVVLHACRGCNIESCNTLKKVLCSHLDISAIRYRMCCAMTEKRTSIINMPIVTNTFIPLS